MKERDGVIASRDREMAKLRSACAERVEDAKATAARLLAEETRSAELRSERCALERERETKRQFAQRRQRAMQSARLRMPSASVFQEPLLPDVQLPALVVHPQ